MTTNKRTALTTNDVLPQGRTDVYPHEERVEVPDPDAHSSAFEREVTNGRRSVLGRLFSNFDSASSAEKEVIKKHFTDAEGSIEHRSALLTKHAEADTGVESLTDKVKRIVGCVG